MGGDTNTVSSMVRHAQLATQLGIARHRTQHAKTNANCRLWLDNVVTILVD
jgi:hypothetical protein